MDAKSALKRFFEEKELKQQTFEIEHNDLVHFVDSELIKELIINSASVNEQEKIREIIVKIDFCNGDVNHFLFHLAEGYIKTNF